MNGKMQTCVLLQTGIISVYSVILELEYEWPEMSHKGKEICRIV